MLLSCCLHLSVESMNESCVLTDAYCRVRYRSRNTIPHQSAAAKYIFNSSRSSLPCLYTRAAASVDPARCATLITPASRVDEAANPIGMDSCGGQSSQKRV
ncbi:hypothetical protein J6590_008081 [Homalodisca vitripennis]|nr:hypothetical protein J6590_008081 [Homalodisca vitripennis]